MGRQIQTSLDKTFWMLSLLWVTTIISQKSVEYSFHELFLESSNCKGQTASNQSIQKVSTVTTRDPRVELFGGPEAEMCPRGFPQLLRKFSQKSTCLAPDEDCPVGFITGQSRQMGNSTETVYQYSAINPTAASPASQKLEQSTFRLIVQQLQRHINLIPIKQLSNDLHLPALLSFRAQRIESSDWDNIYHWNF